MSESQCFCNVVKYSTILCFLYIYIYIYIYMYVYVCACMHACIHACIHACMHTCMYACMYVCMYVCWVWLYIHRHKHTGTGLNPFWPYKFGFKPLLGLEPMAPICPQLLVSHANHSATETSICMYVCMNACMHLCMHTCMYGCMHARMHARMYDYIYVLCVCRGWLYIHRHKRHWHRGLNPYWPHKFGFNAGARTYDTDLSTITSQPC